MTNASTGPERTDVTSRLLGGFKDLIQTGVLRAGSKLPPERELARMFGVSRSSLRQALKFLDIMGVVVQKVGHGSYLTGQASTMLAEPLDLLVCIEGIESRELMEARLMVEPEVAARAAERATTEDLRAIHRTIEAMRAPGLSRKEMVEQDVEFHRAVHRAARNRICESMFSVVHRHVAAAISLANQVVDVRHTLMFHKKIYDAIHEREPEQARQAMREHLLDVAGLLERALAAAPARSIGSSIRPLGEARK